MPPIIVQCETSGFSSSFDSIHWRLKLRHVLCRHQSQGNYRYKGICEVLENEWQGQSKSNNFVLFNNGTDINVSYTFNSNDGNAVMGGHGILEVAAKPTGCPQILSDYIHLRIGGTNPTKNQVLLYVQSQVSNRNLNIVHMLNAIFAHEAGFHQFRTNHQTQATMNFRAKHHHNDPTQPDCSVLFNWPDDPPNFPLATFDFGVGISQYTKTVGRTIPREVAWDWRENIKIGINLFLNHLNHTHNSTLTWKEWAHRAWKRYNGSGAQAIAYAQTLSGTTEGQKVSSSNLPNTLKLNQETAQLTLAPNPEQPPNWPPID